ARTLARNAVANAKARLKQGMSRRTKRTLAEPASMRCLRAVPDQRIYEKGSDFQTGSTARVYKETDFSIPRVPVHHGRGFVSAITACGRRTEHGYPGRSSTTQLSNPAASRRPAPATNQLARPAKNPGRTAAAKIAGAQVRSQSLLNSQCAGPEIRFLKQRNERCRTPPTISNRRRLEGHERDTWRSA